jgi:RNA polymerase sigma-70 factor (ECF subfamily)
MPLEPEETDADALLMLAAAEEDMSAFEQLVRKHQKPLLNFFIRSGVYTDVEDLVQQTFVRLYRYRHHYSRRAKFTTFLYLLARQVRIDEVRKRIRLQKLRERVKTQTEIEPPVHRDAHPALLSDELQTALATLPEGHREVVVLGILQDLPYPEVAKILGIPVGTVKSRMFHALRQLREKLSDANPSEN